METKVLGPITKIVQAVDTTARFIPFTGWMNSSAIKDARWHAWLRDPTSATDFRFRAAYQVARIDPENPSDILAAEFKSFVYELNYTDPFSTGLANGVAFREGGYLTAWEDVQGDTGASPATPGTTNAFWIRFGVEVFENGTNDFEQGEVSLTVAVRD